jgi:hypothetical protein
MRCRAHGLHLIKRGVGLPLGVFGAELRGGEMTSGTSTLVSEEINRIVGEAADGGISLSLSACIEQVTKAYPNCSLSERYVTSEILIAATSAMVAVVMDRKVAG